MVDDPLNTAEPPKGYAFNIAQIGVGLVIGTIALFMGGLAYAYGNPLTGLLIVSIPVALIIGGVGGIVLKHNDRMELARAFTTVPMLYIAAALLALVASTA